MKSSLTTTATTLSLNEYPAGSFLHTEKGYFYVYSQTQRYRFITERVLKSWNPQRIFEASEDDTAVRRLRIFAKMKFRNGSLLYYHQTGKMYVVSDNKLRFLPAEHPLPYEMPVWITEDEYNLHELGQPL